MTDNDSKALAVFDFESRPIRSRLDEKGDPWFAAADVCAALDITNVGNALARLDADEKANIHTVDVSGRQFPTVFINESGLYSLILTSRKPSAKLFKKWVTNEVLPALRKTGQYNIKPGVLSPLEILKQQVAIMEEHDLRLSDHEDRIERLEVRITGIEGGGEHYFTVIGYLMYRKLRTVDTAEAGRLGKLAAAISRGEGYAIGKTTDPRFGVVNTYHEDVLGRVIADKGG